MVPERIREAVARLPLRPESRVLEVGSGSGAAAQLACEIVTDGSMLAIDSSATAVRRTAERNDPHIRAGRLAVAAVELALLDAEDDAFDVAFAVNVNLFWTRDPDPELAVLTRVLRPGGTLQLVYDSGPAGTAAKAVEPVRRALARSDFQEVTILPGDHGVAIVGRRP
jgi:SAM-dependent methyltransferase